MDMWGIAILVIGIVGYFVSKKNPGFLFVIGFGAGMTIAAWYAVYLINQVFGF